jgi:hypothetical protein
MAGGNYANFFGEKSPVLVRVFAFSRGAGGLTRKMMEPATPKQLDWPEALATVTACSYDAGAGRAMAFGLPTSKHFRIAFNYWANGELHSGEFTSEKAVPQGTLFPIHYNPEAPHENTHASNSATTALTRSPLIAVGIIGSIILSLVWFAILRSCH